MGLTRSRRGTSIAPVAKRKRSPCQQEDDARQASKRRRHSVPELPEDIWDRILSLLPLRDAARAGCVSRALLSSWTRRPNLTFTEETLGLAGNACRKPELARTFQNRVYRVLKKHSGVGVKTFKLHHCGSGFNIRDLNRWLQIAVTPGIEEVVLSVPMHRRKYKYGPHYGYEWVSYNFPCSVFSNGSGNSIRHLHLASCAFHPVAGLARLTRLHLFKVDITGDELGCFLSNSFAMEELNLTKCGNVIHLKIPCLLHRLNCLAVLQCVALKVIENKAPNLWIVRIDSQPEKVPVGDVLQVKDLQMQDCYESNLVHYARAKLPSIMPNLETLSLESTGEVFNTPILPVKFLYLKNLRIFLHDRGMKGFSPGYDYFSLVSFLDACPVLENFILAVLQASVRHELISGDLHLRQMPEHQHGNIKNVTIKGFCAAKSMVELTCHILENATSLECLTLDTICDNGSEDLDRTFDDGIARCYTVLNWRMLDEGYRGLRAIERYIVGKVPSTVKLNVNKLSSRRYAIKSHEQSYGNYIFW
ncbi:uncharacterized protein LOC119310821 isoform X1 [Triticum dicoccoides]|uniref:uncharacterized protein LOC119310821 isoform X1 n=1 Tax=Triticum dicoccoides TaxID=85692 RepID=UPI000E7A42E3|nr:uncharacterized protein LOC119310821 isoform X1 [Triticum dicoccoides]